jgi:cytochrome c oxidase subunit III
VTRQAVDVSDLTTYGFGHRSVAWWATMGLIAIEGAVFALMIVNYFYLKGRSPHWPPGFQPPDATWGTINTIVLLASTIPNQLTKSAAERMDLNRVRIWLPVAVVFAVAFSIIRIFEFQSLNVWWDSNAYGSAVWTLLGLHTAHLVTDLVDSAVLAVLMFTGPLTETKLVDVSENALYWYFVVLSWLQIYAVIYFAPRVA